MKANEMFLKACKDKNRSALIVTQRMNKNKETGEWYMRQYMYMCVEERVSKYDKWKKETAYVESDTEIKFDNYYRWLEGDCPQEEKDKAISFVCFHMVATNWTDNHITTFLNAIKKDSDVKFKVLAYNSSDVTKAAGIVCHMLYGYVDGKAYMLSAYAGADNTASPVQSQNVFDTSVLSRSMS